MSTENPIDPREVLRDPEALAVFERNMRGAGMNRRTLPRDGERRRRRRRPRRLRREQQPDRDHRRDRRRDEGPGTAGAAPTTAAPRPPLRHDCARCCDNRSGSQRRRRVGSQSGRVRGRTGGDNRREFRRRRGRPAAATGPDSTKLFIDWSDDVSRWTTTSTATSTAAASRQHMVGLLTYDPDFNLLPELAESYTNSGPVFTFKLRKGITWSDGVPIKASDFVYSIRRMIDPRTANGYGSFWDGVIKGASDLSSAKADAANLDQLVSAVGVKAIDDSTLEITGDKFAGLIPNQSAYAATVVARQDIVTKYADAKGVSLMDRPRQDRRPRARQRSFPDHRMEAQCIDRSCPQRQVLECHEHQPEVCHVRDHPGPYEEHAALRERRCGLHGHPLHGGRPLQERRETEVAGLPVCLSRHPLPRPGHRPSPLR